tara:strand:- start:255 stop:866 length:612 start_codon:yes stop_codon:yes gene_type:complete
MIIQLTPDSSTKRFLETHDIFLDKKTQKLVDRQRALTRELEHYKNNPSSVANSDVSYYQNLVSSTTSTLASITSQLDARTINPTTVTLKRVYVSAFEPLETASLRIQIPWFQDLSNNSSLLMIHSTSSSTTTPSSLLASNQSSILVPLDPRQFMTVHNFDYTFTMTQTIPKFFTVNVTDSTGGRLRETELSKIAEISLFFSQS